MRLAVHTLLAMENITGGIGPYISAIAWDFNNSVKTTEQLEVQIRDRNALVRFFAGGDSAAAAEIANLTVQNRLRIQQMEQLMTNATLDAETRAIMGRQLG